LKLSRIRPIKNKKRGENEASKSEGVMIMDLRKERRGMQINSPN